MQPRAWPPVKNPEEMGRSCLLQMRRSRDSREEKTAGKRPRQKAGKEGARQGASVKSQTMKAEGTYHCVRRVSQLELDRDSVLAPNSGSPTSTCRPAVESGNNKLDGRQGCVRFRVRAPPAMRHGSAPCSTVHRHGSRAPLMRSAAGPAGPCPCACCRCALFSSLLCFRIGLSKSGERAAGSVATAKPCQSGLLI